MTPHEPGNKWPGPPILDLNLALWAVLGLTGGMHDRLWLFLATLGYLASAVCGLYALRSRLSLANRWSFLLIAAAFVLHTLFLHQRGEAIRHCPITNLFETLAFFSWSLVLTYLVVGPAYRMSILGAFTAPVVFLINSFALAARLICRARCRTSAGSWSSTPRSRCWGLGVLGVAGAGGRGLSDPGRQLKRHVLTAWFYTLPNVGRLELVQQRVLILGFLIFSAGALLGFFIPHRGPDDWVKIAWSAAVWCLYGRAGRRAGARPAEPQEDRAAFRGGLRFYPAHVSEGINSLSEAHVFPHEG